MIPEDGVPIDLITQAVVEYLEGEKLRLDDDFKYLEHEAMLYNDKSKYKYNTYSIENVIDKLELSDKRIQELKAHIDSYFAKDSITQFTDYVDNIYYTQWPDRRPVYSQKELEDAAFVASKYYEMKDIYTKLLYTPYTEVIEKYKQKWFGTANSFWGSGGTSYVTKDLLMLQYDIIEEMKLYTNDTPAKGGRSGIPYSPPTKGPLTQLTEIANFIQDKANLYTSNKSIASANTAASKLAETGYTLISDMKKLDFVAKVIGVTVQEAQAMIYEPVTKGYSEVVKLRNQIIENIKKLIKNTDDLNRTEGYTLEKNNQLDISINQEISKILEKNSPNDWELSDVTISKSKK
jgi:hypothetical protein